MKSSLSPPGCIHQERLPLKVDRPAYIGNNLWWSMGNKRNGNMEDGNIKSRYFIQHKPH